MYIRRVKQKHVLLIFLSQKQPLLNLLVDSFGIDFCFSKKNCLHYYFSFYFTVRHYLLTFCSGGCRFIYCFHTPPVQAHHTCTYPQALVLAFASSSRSLLPTEPKLSPTGIYLSLSSDTLGSSSTSSFKQSLGDFWTIPVQTDVLQLSHKAVIFELSFVTFGDYAASFFFWIRGFREPSYVFYFFTSILI